LQHRHFLFVFVSLFELKNPHTTFLFSSSSSSSSHPSICSFISSATVSSHFTIHPPRREVGFTTIEMSAPLADEKVAIEKTPGSDAPSFSDESIDNPMGINEKRLLRKLDYTLLPGLILLYLLSFLDRSNSMPSPPPCP
jgi:hypothetical protein